MIWQLSNAVGFSVNLYSVSNIWNETSIFEHPDVLKHGALVVCVKTENMHEIHKLLKDDEALHHKSFHIDQTKAKDSF